MLRRTTLPRWLWGVLAWLVVVAATSTFAWLAIRSAGEEVVATGSRPLAGAVAGQEATQVPTEVTAGSIGGAVPTDVVPPAVIPTAVPPTTTTTTPPTTGGQPPGTPGSGGSGSSASGSSVSGSGGSGGSEGGPGTSGGSRPPGSSGPGSSTGPGGGASQPAVQSFDARVSLTGGQATVRCTGQRITLRSAIPESGWTVRQEERDTEVRVEFDSDDGTSKLRATCVGGRPSVETDDAAD